MSGSPLGRYPCTSGLWAFSYVSDLDLHHRMRSIHTDFLRSHQNRLADRRQTACQRESAMLGPLRSTAASSAEPSTLVTVTSSWSVGQRLKRLFLAPNQRIMKGCVFDGDQTVAAARFFQRMSLNGLAKFSGCLRFEH